ncbi:VWA domain-containing protein [Streptomyces sp. A1547]|uniref:VWFA domain-containing protein n=1 Tax=Streptomyces sp. R33 TaxID=3238629 RepID=A0AB39Y6B5_9ACTN|nr:VWA domain-containing protein [Streptomyces sp. A1547]THA34963.1 VWA domain-containing protein [Streptomyces sp. A1547]
MTGSPPADSGGADDDTKAQRAGVRQKANASGDARVYQAGRDLRIFDIRIPRSIRNTFLVLVVLALLGGGSWAVVRWVLPAYAPTYKTQFLMDTTAVADAGDADAVAASLRTVVGNAGDSDALALRRFGGECGTDGNTARLVDFGTDNRQDIVRAAQQAPAGGRATLLRGIVQAVDDFSGTFAFGAGQRAKQVNRIVVVTRHGKDACDEDTDFVRREIADRIRAAGLKIEFRLIGYQVPENQSESLKSIATAGSNPAEPVFANTRADLDAALEWSTNTEPVLRNATKIVDVLNPAVTRINTAAREITDGRLDEAGQNLDRAREPHIGTEFEDLGGRAKTPEGRDINDRAAKLREQQKTVLEAADRLLEAARSKAPLGPRHEAFERAATDYNTQVDAMNKALAALRAKAPAAR